MTRARETIGTIARLVMAGTFLWAGFAKVTNLAVAELSVQSYQLMPNQVARVIGIVLPMVEILLGLLLLVGLGTRLVAIILSLMLVAFIFGISSLWVRGIKAQCGCFGNSLIMTEAPSYPLEVFRDSMMLLATVYLVVWPRTLFSLDNWFARRDEANEDEPESEILAHQAH